MFFIILKTGIINPTFENGIIRKPHKNGWFPIICVAFDGVMQQFPTWDTRTPEGTWCACWGWCHE